VKNNLESQLHKCHNNGYDKLQGIHKQPMFVALVQNTIKTIRNKTKTNASQTPYVLREVYTRFGNAID